MDGDKAPGTSYVRLRLPLVKPCPSNFLLPCFAVLCPLLLPCSSKKPGEESRGGAAAMDRRPER